MAEQILFRHNIMNINSIDTFLSVKGGFNNNQRDVYFVRAVGESVNYINEIEAVDKRMNIGIAGNRLHYIRIKKLAVLKDEETSSFYLKAYDTWKETKTLTLKNIHASETFASVIEHALNNTLDKYRSSKSAVTDTMVRNFVVKIFFWTDTMMQGQLADWNERSSIKVLAEDVVKEQEYLYFYFLTLIGCDVLLLENKRDANVTEDLMKLSQELCIGNFGTSELTEYVYSKPEEHTGCQAIEQPQNIVSPQGRSVSGGGIRVAIPERRNRARHAASSQTEASGVLQRTMAGSAGITDNTLQDAREKSFEELAQLASSIVMITMYNADKEPVGTGSGIMIGRDGYILTNNHVVAGGRFYMVQMEDDEKVYPTDEVIKYNSNLDLSVIRIDKQLNPLPIYRGAKKLVRGQKVVAIGSPLGLFNSVSDGIISGFRNIRDVNMIQFTAPTSPGSSGGAVLNMQGEVIGISTAGIDNGQNINLAVSYEDILLFANGFYK